MKTRIVIHKDDIEMGEPILMVLRHEERDGNLTVIDPSSYEHPGAWGVVLADCVQHIVNAYTAQGYSSSSVRDAVLHFFNAELRNPTDKAQAVEVSEDA